MVGLDGLFSGRVYNFSGRENLEVEPKRTRPTRLTRLGKPPTAQGQA
jgi:hypothetical protein